MGPQFDICFVKQLTSTSERTGEIAQIFDIPKPGALSVLWAIFHMEISSLPRQKLVFCLILEMYYISLIQANKRLHYKCSSENCCHVRLFANPWTIVQSMEFSRPKYWSGQPFPSPGDLPNSGIEPRSSALQADSLTFEPPGKPSFAIGENKFVLFCFNVKAV